MSKQLLFSITQKDLRVDYFRCGGKGGQKVNKTSACCRITHTASGAVGLGKSSRKRSENKREAFRNMAEAKKFKSWLRIEIAARLEGYRDVEHKVDQMMDPKNLKIEVF